MRCLYALLLCLACAAPGTTYQRGTPVRPPPAPTRPGVGLPLPGQPVRKPDVQPNPRPKRLLPPQRGPGIWAADEPKDPGPSLPVRKRGDPIPTIWLGTFQCPVAPEAQDAVDTLPTERCEAIMSWAAWRAGVDVKFDALEPKERHCLGAHLLAKCVRWMRDADAEDLDELRKHLSETDLLRRLKMASAATRAAEAAIRKECGDDNKAYSDAARDIEAAIKANDALDFLQHVVLLP